MDHRHVEPPRGPGASPLLHQQAGEQPPFPPLSLEVPVNGGPVTVVNGHNYAMVF